MSRKLVFLVLALAMVLTPVVMADNTPTPVVSNQALSVQLQFAFSQYEYTCIAGRNCLLWIESGRDLTKEEQSNGAIWAIVVFSNKIAPKVIQIWASGRALVYINANEMIDPETQFTAKIIWVSQGTVRPWAVVNEARAFTTPSIFTPPQ